MIVSRLCLALALLFSVSSWAAEVAVPPEPVKVHTLAVVRATGLEDGETPRWMVQTVTIEGGLPRIRQVPGVVPADDPYAYVFTGQPGYYAVTLWLESTAPAYAEVEIVGPAPPPDPGPGPGPGPGPDPTPEPELADLARVLVIYESETLTPTQSVVLSSTPLREYLRTTLSADSVGLPAWRMWDKDQPTGGMPQDWLAAWTKASLTSPEILPRVAAFDSTGKQVVFPLPETVDALIDELKEYAGGR